MKDTCMPTKQSSGCSLDGETYPVMTVREFKAWLDGFCFNMDGAPGKIEWRQILKKLEQVSD